MQRCHNENYPKQINQAYFGGRSGKSYRSRSGEALLLQKVPSGPLGSEVFLRDVGITSGFCENRDLSIDGQKHLRGSSLESALHDE